MKLQLSNIQKSFGAKTVLSGANFQVRDNEKIALVGRNGCGKTTLLKLISGEVEMANPDSDEECGIVMAGKQR